MANLKETAEWPEGIYRIELTDPVVGGEDGIDNLQAKQLAARTQYLKKKIEIMGDTVQTYEPSMQASIYAGLLRALDLAGLAGREHERTRTVRFQELTATIKNRGVKSGVVLTKSTTATRNISASDGVVFMGGREYPVLDQTNTASVASNTTDKAGIVIIYMFLTTDGLIDVAATTLNGTMPAGAIELARAKVPAGNTEENDPYLARVTITDSARREPGWPSVQRAPAAAVVSLPAALPDNGYMVAMEVLSCTGGKHQLGDIYTQDQLNNGFKLVTSGTADDISVRMLVQHSNI